MIMISKAVALFHNSNRNILISLILSFSTLSTFYRTEIIYQDLQDEQNVVVTYFSKKEEEDDF